MAQSLLVCGVLASCAYGASAACSQCNRFPFVSCAADGRDVPDGSSVQFTQQLKDDLQALEAAHPGLDAKIASGGGRMNVTMDRYEVGGGWQPASRCLY